MPYASDSVCACCVELIGVGTSVAGGVVVAEEREIGSMVTAKRMCSMAFESCCFGCCLVVIELSVWKRASSEGSAVESISKLRLAARRVTEDGESSYARTMHFEEGF